MSFIQKPYCPGTANGKSMPSFAGNESRCPKPRDCCSEVEATMALIVPSGAFIGIIEYEEEEDDCGPLELLGTGDGIRLEFDPTESFAALMGESCEETADWDAFKSDVNDVEAVIPPFSELVTCNLSTCDLLRRARYLRRRERHGRSGLIEDVNRKTNSRDDDDGPRKAGKWIRLH